MKKALRSNKVFVDWSQNDDYKTTVCVYSLRARERPTVSTPLTWQEVEHCLKTGDPEPLVFTSEKALGRVEKLGDLFAPVLSLKQKLPALDKLVSAQQEAEPARAAQIRSISSAKPKRSSGSARSRKRKAKAL
jgi:bifunctional non-homologous end joining protein LigD